MRRVRSGAKLRQESPGAGALLNNWVLYAGTSMREMPGRAALCTSSEVYEPAAIAFKTTTFTWRTPPGPDSRKRRNPVFPSFRPRLQAMTSAKINSCLNFLSYRLNVIFLQNCGRRMFKFSRDLRFNMSNIYVKNIKTSEEKKLSKLCTDIIDWITN